MLAWPMRALYALAEENYGETPYNGFQIISDC
jgi:hypothetical protein